MIIALILPIIERIANHALKSDPMAIKNLSSINGQIICVDCHDWCIQLYIIPGPNGLSIEKRAPTKPDTTVKSTLSNFLQLLTKGADTTALFKHPVEIQGNTHNMEVLRDTFKNLDIDWEEELSHIFGDALAHKICFYSQKANEAKQSTEEKLKTNIQEYLFFESKLLPTKEQVENLYTDIAHLKNDVDRLEARIALFLADKKEH